MKTLLMKCSLALFSVGLTGALFLTTTPNVIASPNAKNEECYPITFFDTLKIGVTKYKELTTSAPVLIPTWFPFETPLKTVRIEGCGAILKMEYVSDNHKIRVHVSPQYKNLKGDYSVSLSDNTKARFQENNLFYSLRFDKRGRNYMILIDKINVEHIERETAKEYLVKISNSLADFR